MLNLVSDDIIQMILIEWLSSIYELAMVDLAICSRSLRSRYLRIIKRYEKAIGTVCIKEEKQLQLFIQYKQSRNIFLLDLQIRMEIGLINTFTLGMQPEAKTFCLQFIGPTEDVTAKGNHDESSLNLHDLLTYLPNLENLELSACYNHSINTIIGDTSGDVNSFPLLRNIEFYFPLISNEFNTLLAYLADKCPHLESMTFRTCQYFPVIKYIVPILICFPSLQSLAFEETVKEDLVEDNEEKLPTFQYRNLYAAFGDSSSLLTFPSLKCLSLELISLTDEHDLEELSNFFVRCSRLETVVIPHALAMHIPSFQTIFRNQLKNAILSTESPFEEQIGLHNFPSSLQYASDTIQTLSIRSFFEDFDDDALLTVITYCKQLKILTLSMATITSIGIRQFCHFITTQRKRRKDTYRGLKSLSIECCPNLGDKALHCLLSCDALMCHSLKKFSFTVGRMFEIDNIKIYQHLLRFLSAEQQQSSLQVLEICGSGNMQNIEEETFTYPEEQLKSLENVHRQYVAAACWNPTIRCPHLSEALFGSLVIPANFFRIFMYHCRRLNVLDLKQVWILKENRECRNYDTELYSSSAIKEFFIHEQWFPV